MVRAAADWDVFNAIAEARRREILVLRVPEERSVREIIDALELDQPSVPEHLRVLYDVGLVWSRRNGQRNVVTCQHSGASASEGLDVDVRAGLAASA